MLYFRHGVELYRLACEAELIRNKASAETVGSVHKRESKNIHKDNVSASNRSGTLPYSRIITQREDPSYAASLSSTR